jgi:transposase-like protein
MAIDLSDKIFHDEEAAQAHIEASRWPQGPYCPFCGSFNVHRLGGKTQAGYLICRDCKPRKKFTCRTATVMERSHVPLHKWLLATHLMAASKKGMSAHQFARMLDVQFKTAWFLAHRIRESMRDTDTVPIGGAGGSGTVEADETYHGKITNPQPSPNRRSPYTKGGKSGPSGKRAIVALVERGGKARLFHMAVPDKYTVEKIVRENVAKEARLYTDESKLYTGSVEHFAAHETVKHSAGEYVRDDIHTNTVEGAFGIFKRRHEGRLSALR